MAEMNWNEMKTGGNGEGLQTMKLLPGPNQVRIVGLPYETEVHWESANDGSKKRIVCLGVGCPICKAGHVPQKRFQVLVMDRADKKLKILEGGTSIFKQIREIAMDADYGDPSNYDLKIKKEGTGRETKYTVLASPNKSPITQEEQELVNNSKSLKEINAPKSLEDIIALDLEVLSGMSTPASDFDGGWGSDSSENIETVSGDSDSDWDNL
jgi:hypothetical protein